MPVGAISQSGTVAAQAACMEAEKPGGWMSGGLLTRRTFKDAAGRPETAYILTMPQAECLKSQNSSDNVRPTSTIQVYGSDGAMDRKIQRYLGKRVVIEGRAFGAITAHHHAPIVVELSSIDLP